MIDCICSFALGRFGLGRAFELCMWNSVRALVALLSICTPVMAACSRSTARGVAAPPRNAERLIRIGMASGGILIPSGPDLELWQHRGQAGGRLLIGWRDTSDARQASDAQRQRSYDEWTAHYRCTRFDAGPGRMQCAVPFARGSPEWQAVLALVDSLGLDQPPTGVEPRCYHRIRDGVWLSVETARGAKWNVYTIVLGDQIPCHEAGSPAARRGKDLTALLFALDSLARVHRPAPGLQSMGRVRRTGP
jgi:hypothetical protein